MHRSRAFLSLLIIGALALGSVMPAYAVTKSDLEKHQNAADSARKKAKAAEETAERLADEVEGLDSEIEKIESQAEALEPKIRAAAKRTDRIEAELNHLKTEVAETKQEIVETQAEYERQQELLRERVNETYRQGEWFYIDVLLGSEDFSDLIQRTEFVSRIIDSNNDVAAALEATGDSLSRAKVKLDRSLKSVKIKRREAASVEASLRELHAQREAAAASAEAMQGRKAQLVVENKTNAKRLRALAAQEEAESARIARELASSTSGAGVYGGIMAWPVPASSRITSPFGWRTHPIFGDRRLHTGIDIGAPQGSAIVAAGDGTVIYAGYRGGYGNTIMIDHGDGLVTLYAHQSSFNAGNGQSVSKGQRIGSVGSTGNSTGPHLHFETRVNGVPKNPMGYM